MKICQASELCLCKQSHDLTCVLVTSNFFSLLLFGCVFGCVDLLSLFLSWEISVD